MHTVQRLRSSVLKFDYLPPALDNCFFLNVFVTMEYFAIQNIL